MSKVLSGIVKARRNSRQPSESGDSASNASSPPPNRPELMRKAMQTSPFEADDTTAPMFDPNYTPSRAGNNGLLSPLQALRSGKESSSARSVPAIISAPASPTPELAASASTQSLPGHTGPGDGSLTFESLALPGEGTSDLVMAEPVGPTPASAPSSTRQRPSTAATLPETGFSGLSPLSNSNAPLAGPEGFTNGPPASRSVPTGLLHTPSKKEGLSSPRFELSPDASMVSLGSPSKSTTGSGPAAKLRQTLSKGKSNNAASSHGIAGALAATAMTGMGVGAGTHALASSPQNSLLVPTANGSASTPKRPGLSRTASGSNLSTHGGAHGRDLSSATFIDHGANSDNEDAHHLHTAQRSQSARRPAKHHDYADDEAASSEDGVAVEHPELTGSNPGLTVEAVLKHNRNNDKLSAPPSLVSAEDPAYMSDFSSGAGRDAAASMNASAAAQALLAPTAALAALGGARSITPDHGPNAQLVAPPSMLDPSSRRVSSEMTPGYEGGGLKRPPLQQHGKSGSTIAAGLARASEAALVAAAADPTQFSGMRTPGSPLPQPVLTPSGIGAVGGLSPSGLGERLELKENGRSSAETFPSSSGAAAAAAAAATVEQNSMEQSQYSTMSMPPVVTGFAVASTKRNNAFHQLFSAVPEDDFLIEDYACALAREILVQGRLYVSEAHLAFNANIFGWVTNVVIPFSDIVSIEKRMTAFVIPNAIQISTLHAKHTFTSFLSRDTAYDLIANIWKLSHPNFTANVDAMPDFSDDESVADGSISEKGDEAQDQARKATKRQRLREKLHRAGRGGGGGGGRSQTGGDTTADKDGDVSKSSSVGGGGGGASGTGSTSGGATGAGSSTPKKAAHRATTCACEKKKEHYSTVVMDAKFPAVPEKMYNMMFTSGFMKDFWQSNQKLMDLQMSDWSPDPANKNMLSRSMSYIKPLNGSIGPKQTKCHITDENLHVDFDDYVSTLTTTKTPDVPCGNIFAVKTRTCFTWAGGNTTKIYVTCTVEWSGRSMLKGIIDKASIDGQRQYYKDLDAAIHEYLKEHASEFKEEGDEVIEDEASIDTQDKEGGAADSAGADSAASTSNKAKGGDANTESSAANTSSTSITGLVSSFADTVTNAVSSGLGMVTDAVSGASPSMLILGSVVIVLLLSNLWALTIREPPAGYRSVPRSPYGYGGSGGAGAGSQVGGGGGPDSDALAAALRDVLREHFGPAGAPGSAATGTPKSGKAASGVGGKSQGVSGSGDRVDEIKQLMSMISDAESKIAKLKGELAFDGVGRR
ncbi:hypothetical protein OC845_003230 [Tilletia horrida]|nr:hypothetical protein OC845_003230 [Tilletia horrida]